MTPDERKWLWKFTHDMVVLMLITWFTAIPTWTICFGLFDLGEVTSGITTIIVTCVATGAFVIHTVKSERS